MRVRLIALTKPNHLLAQDGIITAEQLMVYAARVSNPSNQMNTETGPRLLRYCIRNGHWSVFETSSMTVEITTSRAIAAQLLRHRSFTFQEFSQRYATALMPERIDLRTQHPTNRQASGDPVHDTLLATMTADAVERSFEVYEHLIAHGISRETARMVLPLCTQTVLYMTGNIRSWIHYLEQRTSEGTQKEHREISLAIKAIFTEKFPNIARALYESHA